MPSLRAYGPRLQLQPQSLVVHAPCVFMCLLPGGKDGLRTEHLFWYTLGQWWIRLTNNRHCNRQCSPKATDPQGSCFTLRTVS